MEPSWSRRSFLRSAAAVAALATGATRARPADDATGGRVPLRPFGRTGATVSAIGLGGYHVGSADGEDAAVRLVHEAIDAGITFLDNAWEYHGGRSEEWMGTAIADRRERVFLMTKVCTHGRGKDEAMRQLEASLRRLRTDHLDCWQVHECVYDDDPARHYAPGGVLEALDQAKREGKTRFVGFTGHKSPAIHLEMLRRGYPFDSCQMPLNCLDASFRSFEREVLPECVRRGIAVIGMKSLGGLGNVVRAGVPVADALRYAMSLPVATTVSGMESLDVLRQNLAIAAGFRPLPPEAMSALRQRWASQAADGHLELYKTSMAFDGPVGRAQHGFPPPTALPG